MTHNDMICQECENAKNLWICLICGFTGCGRYQKRHAVGHSEITQHQFSLEISSKRIWNYFGDNYVHRMIRSAWIMESHHSVGATQAAINRYIGQSEESGPKLGLEGVDGTDSLNQSNISKSSD
jgi:BRCA1-associated protein